MTYVITAAVSLVIGLVGGVYGHYKFGSKLAALEAKVKSVV